MHEDLIKSFQFDLKSVHKLNRIWGAATAKTKDL